MSTHSQRGRFTLSALALGMACLVGCTTVGKPGGDPPEAPGSGTVTATEAANVHVALGRTLEKRGATEQAMATYQDALKRDSHCAEAHVRLGVLHDLKGDPVEAAKCYRQALKESPGDADVFCDMGYSFYLQRRWAEAEINLRQAVALKPEHQRAHMNLGLLLARTERVPEALAEFRAAKCSAADADVNVAFAQALGGRLEEAATYYQRALTADPSSEAAKAGLSEVRTLTAKAHQPVHGAAQTAVPVRLTSADASEAAPAVRQALAVGPAPAPAPGPTPAAPATARLTFVSGDDQP